MPEPVTNSTQTRRLLAQVRASEPGAVDRLLTHYRRYLCPRSWRCGSIRSSGPAWTRPTWSRKRRWKRSGG